jgi:glycosyltransferase involved in cell wall biosynthesis
MVFVSTIIPSVGRQTLSRAVESVLAQDNSFLNFEVIVVNDSGEPLPEASWQRSGKVQILHTHHRERSIARNTGAAVAKGNYLHFLDDDDWLAPGAYRYFWELSQSGPANWLYGVTQLLNREGITMIQLRHSLAGNCFLQVMAGEWIPIQSSLIDRATFMRVGGFNPLLAGPEDIDLLRRVSLVADLAETPHLVSYVVWGEEGSTTDYTRHPPASRAAREMILESPGIFTRMHTSAASPFWHGRMLRVYLTSVIWNLRHRRPFSAISRLLYASACALVAGRSLFSADFWQAVSQPYESLTFQRGIQEASPAQP